MAHDRPHVVWFMCDQLRWDALGFTGNPHVRTPNLDRLARRGVVFDGMFVQSPVCMTSRASMLTSRYLCNLNMANGCPVLDPWEVTVPEMLQRAGYRTGHFGKLHLTPQQYTQKTLKSDRPIHDAAPFWHAAGMATPLPTDPVRRNYGFQETVGFEDILWGEYVEWFAEHAPDLAKRMDDAWRRGERPSRACFFEAFLQREYRDTGVVDIPPELHPSMFIGESAAAFFRRRAAAAPYFLHVSFVDPHHPFDPPRAIASTYAPADMPAPRPPAAIAWPASLRERADDFSDSTDEQTRKTIAYYYAMIETIDRGVGRVIDAVEEAGAMDDTIFVFATDHGELLGDHGLWRKGSYPFNCMNRTPCFIAAPGRLPGNVRVGGLTQAIDIAPTLLSLAGADRHEGMQGDDLAPALQGGETIGRDWAYTEMYTAPWGPFVASWTLRTPAAMLSYYPQDRRGILFDLADDPGETRDRWDDHPALRRDMLEQLLQARHEQTDPLPRVLSQY